ncbi:MAG: hypothetical protein ACOC6Q_01870 [Patescibacteria group bacterium]
MKPRFIFLFFLSIFVSLGFLFPRRARAAYVWDAGGGTGGQSISEIYDDILERGEVNSWTWLTDIAFAGTAWLNKAIGPDGAAGAAATGVSYMYKSPPPVHFNTYLASLDPTQPAYAASAGRSTLEFILDLWRIARDIAYSLFAVVLVVIGFMIMFRHKLDPRTEITVVSALPKVVVGLVLVTFSYAISALVVDLGMVVGKNLVVATVNRTGVGYKDFTALDLLWSEELGLAGLFSVMEEEVAREVDVFKAQLIKLVLSFMLFSVFFKLLIKLIICYAKIFLYTLGAPFVFLLGSLPGGWEKISNWLRNFFSVVLVFPATYFILNLAYYVNKAGEVPDAGDIRFFHGLLGENLVMKEILFFGLLLIAASVPDIVASLLQERPGDTIPREAGNIPIIGGFLS